MYSLEANVRQEIRLASRCYAPESNAETYSNDLRNVLTHPNFRAMNAKSFNDLAYMYARCAAHFGALVLGAGQRGGR